MKKIAVYGSLKAGKYNHPMISGCNKIADTTVVGTLYKVSSYPALIESGDNHYEAEVYEVPDNVYERVRNMELGAGYKEVVVEGNIVYYADTYLEERCKDRYEVIETY